MRQRGKVENHRGKVLGSDRTGIPSIKGRFQFSSVALLKTAAEMLVTAAEMLVTAKCQIPRTGFGGMSECNFGQRDKAVKQ